MDALKNRITKNVNRLRKWANSNNYQAFRVYEKDIPEFPYIIDKYSNYIIIWQKGNSKYEEGQIKQVIQETFDIEGPNIIFKMRERKHDLTQYEKLSSQKKLLTVQEGNINFAINPYDYLDVGLFLDHRPLREIIGSISNEKSILNLFSYTCAISVYGALGGGIVTSVDISNTYLEWGKENFKLNNLEVENHEFIKEDCIKYLKRAKRKFDLIIIDPPTFSNAKKRGGNFEVERDQMIMLSNAKRLLNKDGIIYFSNNKTSFKLAPEVSNIFFIEDITEESIPPDFRNSKIHNCYKLIPKDYSSLP